ncbi:MAG: hypothetical protein JO092_04540, partial [Candidatus Eremiobacteraeota bacterium]|nr:hypothetical protein [Candidatus Eremiobacteraeota bacterium]
FTFGQAQYGWSGNGPYDLPYPDRGIALSVIRAGDSVFTVAPRSLTVLRGAIGP